MIDYSRYEGHTPGPWDALSCLWDDDGNVAYILKGERRGNIFTAKLISDAPLLLAECKRLEALCKTLHDCCVSLHNCANCKHGDCGEYWQCSIEMAKQGREYYVSANYKCDKWEAT